MTAPWYTIRPMREDDRAFIADTWVNSYAPAVPAIKALRSDYLARYNRGLGGALKHRYYCQMRPHVAEWMDRGTVLVACLEADDGVIVGWACGERTHHGGATALHYCYIKSAYRRQGVARDLRSAMLQRLGADSVVITHITPMAEKAGLTRGLPHVPWLAFTTPQEVPRASAQR